MDFTSAPFLNRANVPAVYVNSRTGNPLRLGIFNGNTDVNATLTATRTFLAKFDKVHFSAAATPATLGPSIAAIKAINPNVLTQIYCVFGECLNYQITGLSCSGTVASLTYAQFASDGVTPSYIPTNGQSISIRGATNTGYNGDNITIVSNSVTGGVRTITFNVASTLPTETGTNAGFQPTTNNQLPYWKYLWLFDWWLKNNTTGLHTNWGTFFADDINMTVSTGVDGNGDRWPQYYAKYLATNFLGIISGLDGVFIDNFFRSELNYTKNADWDRSGSNQTATQSAAKIRVGYAAAVDQLRASMPGIYVIGNTDHGCGDPEYLGLMDGGFCEGIFGNNVYSDEFKKDNWFTAMNHYSQMLANTRDRSKCWFECQERLVSSTPTYSQRSASWRYGLAAYYMLDGAVYSPRTLVAADAFPDELSYNLGPAIEPEQLIPRNQAGNPNIWMRKFTNGVVIGNSDPTNSQTATVGTPPAGGTYSLLNGTADPAINTGAAVVGGQVTLSPRRGLVLRV